MNRREPMSERLGYAAYGLLGALLAIPAIAVAGTGALFSRRWRAGLPERFGFLPAGLESIRARSPRLWIHAASIGEVRAAIPLIASLRERRPEAAIHLTTTTPEGNRVARELKLGDSIGMLPADLPGLPGRVLDAVAPDALILLETELWPALIRAARRRNVPVLVVNGRISTRSFRRYHAVRTLLGPVLDDIAAFAMQSPVDRVRIIALGADPARVEVFGNLKYDALGLPQPPPPEPLAPLAKEIVWIAGSTHEGEETAVADAFLLLRRDLPDLRLVVAPRHLRRSDEAVRALASRGLDVVRRSTLAAPLAAGQVLLLDSAGELAALYGLARAVFVGGSLVPKGGHNPLEPLAHGRPVAFGPFTENFRDVTAVALESGGARRVSDPALLAETMRDWLSDPAVAREAGLKARAWILSRHGATSRTLALLERWIGPGDPRSVNGSPVQESWLGLDERPVTRAVARAAAAGYRSAVSIRGFLYDHRALPVGKARVPVIAIGNLVAGGVGKTPAAMFLARLLSERGFRVAVVSRGYGGHPGASPRVVSAGGWNRSSHEHIDASVAGDEPLLIAARVPDAAVVVHPDRVLAAATAVSLGAEIILLDDGLQHRRLERDLEIVLLDAAAPFGNGRFLPAGPLRDTPARLADAGLVLLTRADAAGPAATARAAARASLVTSAPIARFGHRITRFEKEGPARIPVPTPELDSLRPFAFCGIARPESFLAGLRHSGIHPSGFHAYADHEAFTPADVGALETEARASGARALLTTEKDAVRLLPGALPVFVAVLDFEPLEPSDAAVLERILLQTAGEPTGRPAGHAKAQQTT